MTTPPAPERSRSRLTSRVGEVRDRVVATVFGDRGGVVVFLAAVLFVGALWRIGFFITDSTTVANAVANVVDGRLAIVEVPYSLTADIQPGIVEVDGRPYARNYGHVYLAAIVYWLLAGVTAVVPVSLVLLGAWCLGLVGLSRSTAILLGRPRLALAGSGLAVAVLVASLATMTPIQPNRLPLVSLQLSTVLLTAAAGTISYRLLAHFHTRRVGLVAGTFVVLATPLGFWASLPKRHALTATLALAAVYCFAVSRTNGRQRTRAAGYAAIGLLASVQAFEAAFILLVFVPVDLLTAPETDGRTLALVGTVFLLSTTPMLATNAAISGDPLAPPRALSGGSATGFTAGLGGAGTLEAVEVSPSGPNGRAAGTVGAGAGIEARVAGAGGSPAAPLVAGRWGPFGGTGGRGGVSVPLWLGAILGVVRRAWFVVAFVLDAATAGLAAATEPDRLYHVFVRSGWNPFVRYHVMEFEAVDLALLEVLPLAGALAYVPVAGVRRLRNGIRPAAASLRSALADPVRQTDLLVGSLAVTFVLVYLPRLPLHSQITLRYVVPAMALLTYGVVRLAPVRRAIDDAPLVLGVGYLVTAAAVVGGLSLAVATLQLAVGEAMQLQALVGLAAACLAALAVGGWPLHRDERTAAIGVAVPAGVTTAFLVLSSLVYFEYARFALPLGDLLAELLPAVA